MRAIVGVVIIGVAAVCGAASAQAAVSSPTPVYACGPSIGPNCTATSSGDYWTPQNVTIGVGQSVAFRLGYGDHGFQYQPNADWSGVTNCPSAATNTNSNFPTCTFTRAGTFYFQCSVHTVYMQGVVTVTGASGPPPAQSPTGMRSNPPPTRNPTPAPAATHSATAQAPSPTPGVSPSPASVALAPTPAASDSAGAVPNPPAAAASSSGGGSGPLVPIVGAVVVVAALAGGGLFLYRRRRPG